MVVTELMVLTLVSDRSHQGLDHIWAFLSIRDTVAATPDGETAILSLCWDERGLAAMGRRGTIFFVLIPERGSGKFLRPEPLEVLPAIVGFVSFRFFSFLFNP